MNLAILVLMAVLLILFIWGWIGLVMFHYLSIEKRLEKLINITNPLPEEERELSYLKEQRTIEQSKIRSAKWILILFMLAIMAAVGLSVYSAEVRSLFGIPTLSQAIMIGVVVLVFFCMPTYLGLALAGSSSKLPKASRPVTQEEEKNA
jgi:hypothetical protein